MTERSIFEEAKEAKRTSRFALRRRRHRRDGRILRQCFDRVTRAVALPHKYRSFLIEFDIGT
jgi:hypothetical protein